jgi:hypothetical protein
MNFCLKTDPNRTASTPTKLHCNFYHYNSSTATHHLLHHNQIHNHQTLNQKQQEQKRSRQKKKKIKTFIHHYKQPSNPFPIKNLKPSIKETKPIGKFENKRNRGGKKGDEAERGRSWRRLWQAPATGEKIGERERVWERS